MPTRLTRKEVSMSDDKDRYRPRQIEELEADRIPVSLVNELLRRIT